MTRPLAHHRTCTFHIHSHIMTEPLAHFDLHITNHSHITALAHYDRTTRTFNQSLAHHYTRTRTFHVHSHIMTGLLAHNQLLAHHPTRTL